MISSNFSSGTQDCKIFMVVLYHCIEELYVYFKLLALVLTLSYSVCFEGIDFKEVMVVAKKLYPKY